MFALGADRGLTTYAEEFLQAKAGMTMLDVGCGQAPILDYLPDLVYTGMDLNEKHIATARQRYGDKGRFIVGDVSRDLNQQNETFDLINVSAVLHHLSDDEAKSLFRALRPLMKPRGRIVTLDAVWLPKQRAIARFLNRLDSGMNIRTPEGYVSLLDGLSLDVQTRTLNNLIRVPYDHFVMVGSFR
jgi:ubiquinone/menaquinone biosynthesis C-methylase UbiE